MLVLSRQVNQSISIFPDIVVKVIRISQGRVHLGIDAPSDVAIFRSEIVADAIARGEPLRKLEEQMDAAENAQRTAMRVPDSAPCLPREEDMITPPRVPASKMRAVMRKNCLLEEENERLRAEVAELTGSAGATEPTRRHEVAE